MTPTRAAVACFALRRGATVSIPNVPVASRRLVMGGLLHRAVSTPNVSVAVHRPAMVSLMAAAAVMALPMAAVMAVRVSRHALRRRPAAGAAVAADVADAGGTDGGHQCAFCWWKTTRTCSGC